MLGIIVLDTRFPRIRGDVGAADTFDFPVRHARIDGATVEALVHERDETLLPLCIDAGKSLVQQGCDGIVTTCGFLVRWQRELARALPVPVLTSALLAVPLMQRLVGGARPIGIVTYSAADLDRATLAAAGIEADTPIAGVDPDGYFATTIRRGSADLDVARMQGDTVAAARALVEAHPNVGAIVLECTNMPPYRLAVREALNRPVFDAAELFAWFHGALK